MNIEQGTPINECRKEMLRCFSMPLRLCASAVKICIFNLHQSIMKQTNVFIAIISLCICSSGFAQVKPNANLEEARKAIAESNAIYFQAFVKNDSSIFINRYAEDCCIMMPGSPAQCGPKAPLEFFKMAYHQLGLRNGKFITTGVFGDGKEFVTEVGTWYSYDVNNKLYDNGKFLVLWKKTPKGWKMFRDSFSSDKNN
jgi:ketosteroid isomerase-like protein